MNKESLRWLGWIATYNGLRQYLGLRGLSLLLIVSRNQNHNRDQEKSLEHEKVCWGLQSFEGSLWKQNLQFETLKVYWIPREKVLELLSLKMSLLKRLRNMALFLIVNSCFLPVGDLNLHDHFGEGSWERT